MGQPLFPVTPAHWAQAEASRRQREINHLKVFAFNEHLLRAYSLPDWIMSCHVRGSLRRLAKNKCHFRNKWREEEADD